jgi:hypothetical protein
MGDRQWLLQVDTDRKPYKTGRVEVQQYAWSLKLSPFYTHGQLGYEQCRIAACTGPYRVVCRGAYRDEAYLCEDRE